MWLLQEARQSLLTVKDWSVSNATLEEVSAARVGMGVVMVVMVTVADSW